MKDAYVILFVSLVAVILLLLFGKVFYDKPPIEMMRSQGGYDNIVVENYTPSFLVSNEYGKPQKEFTIYNHLVLPIRIRSQKGQREIGSVLVGARSSKTLGKEFFAKHFADGNAVTVYTTDETKPGKAMGYYTSYVINTPDAFIKYLNVGQITTRYVAGNVQGNMKAPNAVDGLLYVFIHNMTDRYLSLGETVRIGPQSKLIFKGTDHLGVRLGTVFKDNDGIHPDFILQGRLTDIYYGVTTDLVQPLMGGFQLTDEFDDEPYGMRYPLEYGDPGMGGGPVEESIDPNYLPLLGPPVPDRDRWGL